MSDLSDRFTQTLPCGCEYHAGQWFPCATHQTPHSQHTTLAPGCPSCENLLDEARALQAERPWEAP